jgi:hypothetical protein
MGASIRTESNSIADLVRDSPYRWITPRHGSMRVLGVIFASKAYCPPRSATARFGGLRTPIQRVYDVSHNLAKVETHDVEGHRSQLCVHRKGETRALPAGHPDLPAVYRDVGQPVLVPGSMGQRLTCSSAKLGTRRSLRRATEPAGP